MRNLLGSLVCAAVGLALCVPALVAHAGDGLPAGKNDPDVLRQAAMNNGGNAERGKAIFSSPTTKCATCHKAQGQGGDLGPDLSQIGGKFDRTHLIESILDPSAEILQGYQSITIELTSGRVVTGIVKSESASAVALINAEGKTITIPVRDIELRRVSKVSLMPTGLADGLKPAEFTDLIAYLETLRTGRQPTPGEGVTGTIKLPAGFKFEVVAKGLSGAAAMEVAPDGRIFICEQTGTLRVVKDGKLLTEPFVTLPVDSTWERGLIGVTVAPDFPRKPDMFVCYVAAKPYPHHVVSRFTADGDAAKPDSEEILLVRINSDGSIPDDNPFVTKAVGKYRAIWALGLRNPFTFAVQPGTGRILINDVGSQNEEINEGVAGANYGWPTVDHGPTTDPRFRSPIHYYPTACVIGGAFAPTDLGWPKEYRGKYFFGDFNHGWIKTLDPARPERSNAFATGIRRLVDLRFAPDGNLYVLVRDAWVIDKMFKGGTGALLRIQVAEK
jgi:putative heme-binding domain-containing protein